MKSLSALITTGLLGMAIAGTASAGSILTVATGFTVSGTFSNSSVLSGTLEINLASPGTIVSAGTDLYISSLPGETFTSPTSGSDVVDGNGDNIWANVGLTDGEGDTLNLDLFLGTATSLIGYTGGALCDSTDNCTSSYVSSYTFNQVEGQLPGELVGSQNVTKPLTVGNLSPAPEPASFVLLAVPAVWAIARKRRMKRAA